ncbi:MAG: deoxyribose-phosphate aldolase [Deltaproteobacteria bacterium]|nr:deoxyribose-phosphate aldolase [Deltaproteobacteria bacterium]
MDALVDALVTRVQAVLNGEGRSAQADFKWQYGAGWDANVTFVPGHVIHAAGRSDVKVARHIDHTMLKPEVTTDDLTSLCAEAARHRFYSVCVNSSNVPLCVDLLRGTGVLTICVVGFPLGACLPQVKAYEAQEAIKLGAKEIDTVINIGALKSGDYDTVLQDLAMTVEASKPYPVKVILETSKLNEEEKVAGCVLSREAGAAYVKTSTGFGGGGATIEDVKLMKRVVGAAGIKVKASGGVRNAKQAWAMLEAGADRIGASSSVEIVTGGQATGDY